MAIGGVYAGAGVACTGILLISRLFWRKLCTLPAGRLSRSYGSTLLSTSGLVRVVFQEQGCGVGEGTEHANSLANTDREHR